MAYAPDARPLGDLFADLTREIGTLIQAEVALARTEFSDKAARVARHATVIVGGALLATAGVYAVIAALILLVIRAGLPPWAAALVVGVGVLAVGVLMASNGLAALRRENLKPTETINTIKETATWKEQGTR